MICVCFGWCVSLSRSARPTAPHRNGLFLVVWREENKLLADILFIVAGIGVCCSGDVLVVLLSENSIVCQCIFFVVFFMCVLQFMVFGVWCVPGVLFSIDGAL